MKITAPFLKKVIRKALREHGGDLTPAGVAEWEVQWDLAYEIAKKLMSTPYYNEKQVADQMSGGLYSSDPSFKLLVDRMYESLENEASGP
tara:strand:+ start:1112 stop:1381 length:270 start_codon:yes stop_codon:yes gene_type:complete